MPTEYVACPKCAGGAEKVVFTWWGGLLGPKILTHVKCTSCGHAYNGKTGRDNTTGIVLYIAIAAIFALGLLVVGIAALVALLTLR